MDMWTEFEGVTIDSAFSLHQAEISLLRQTGHLEEWLRQAALSPTSPAVQPRP